MTLVELLVVMTLIGLISVMLAGGFSFGARVWKTVATSSGNLDRIVHTQRFLARQLAQAQVPTRPAPAGGAGNGAAGPVFAGGSGRLVFTAPWQKALGLARVFRFEPAQAGRELRVSWTPVKATPAAAGPDGAEFTGSRALLRDIDRITIRYFGSDDGATAPQWHDGWAVPDRLPLLVGIDVDFAEPSGRVWPRLVVSLAG